MNHKVRAIDLKPGMFVIISEWLDEQPGQKNTEMGMFGPYEIEAKRKPVGDPLKILAVALPYVTVEVIQHRQRGVIDTRLSEFIKVNLAYVRSLVPDYGRRPKLLTDGEKKQRDGIREIELSAAKEGFWKSVTRFSK